MNENNADSMLQQLPGMLNMAGVTTSSGGINWAGLIANMIFSTIGFVVFMYGKKEKKPKPFLIGIVMMVYTYFIPNTLLIYIIGIALCAVLYYWRD